MPNAKNYGQIATLANDIVESVHKPFRLSDNEYPITVSVGISLYPTDSTTEESLMRNADVAMYRAKKQGRDGYCFFSKKLESDLLNRHLLEQLLRETIEKASIEVFFQPQLQLNTNCLVAAEALARLKDAQGNYISPLDFIPLAEELGLINKLGLQILRYSCLAAKKWSDLGMPIRICVNISAKQFASPNFINEVSAILEETHLRSSLLELEVTESVLMHDYQEVKDILEKLSLMGISIAIDDFGTGYSSLSYLKLLPVDVLKIDQSFVKDMLTDEQSLNIVKTIIYLANALKLTIVAEGIENEEDRMALTTLKCQVGQGYLFSRPLPQVEFEKKYIPSC